MGYSFAFSTIARTVQVRLQRGEDIAHLGELDRKYWLMLSCSVGALGPAGEKVARALDSDGDGRVRVPEVLAGIAWLAPRLASFDSLFEPAVGLRRAELNGETPEGAPLAKLLERLAPAGASLSEAKAVEAFAAFRASSENGDGVVQPGVAGSKFAPVGEAIVAVTGGAQGVDGQVGLSAANVAAFEEALAAYKAWRSSRPQGVVALAEAVQRLATRIEAFFESVALVRYNPAAADEGVRPMTWAALAEAPLALGGGVEGVLPFGEGRLNPRYAAEMAGIVAWVQAREPGAEGLSAEAWRALQAEVAPLQAWLAAKPQGATVFAGLDEQVLALSGEASVMAAFRAALSADEAQAPLAAAFGDLLRVLTLRVGLLHFLRNFVNMEDLYPPAAGLQCQVGTLYLDGRACSLCFPIEQAAGGHAAGAGASHCCLVYCRLSRPAEQATRMICAVFTAGSAETLTIGRNGLFYDLAGKDWEATVVHLVANPLGLWEAFFAPWRKVAAAFSGVVRKVFVGRHEEATAALVARAEGAGAAAAAAEKVPMAGGQAMASVATLGIALSFVATAVTGLVAALTNTPVWKTGLAVLGLIAVVSVPSVILTWLKLRGRDLAPILNASGWAVNRRIGLTAGLGRYFTQRAAYAGKRFVPAPLVTHTKQYLLMVVVAGLLATAWWFLSASSPRQRRAAEAARHDAPVATELAEPVAPVAEPIPIVEPAEAPVPAEKSPPRKGPETALLKRFRGQYASAAVCRQ